MADRLLGGRKENAAVDESTIADRIIGEVFEAPGCRLEELVVACPDLTWKQVFLAVDRLSRTGQVHMTMKGPGIYTVSLPGKQKEAVHG